MAAGPAEKLYGRFIGSSGRRPCRFRTAGRWRGHSGAPCAFRRRAVPSFGRGSVRVRCGGRGRVVVRGRRVRVVLDDALQPAQLRAFVQGDQRHALRRAAQFADLRHACAHQHALVGDQHDLVFRVDQGGGDDLAVALALLDGDHPLRAAAVAGVFDDAGALAVAVLGGGEHALRLVLRHQHGDHALTILQHHAAHAARGAAQRPHVVLVEAHGLAAVGEEHHVVLAVGERSPDEVVAVVQVHGDDAALARVAELVQRRLLHRAHAGRHEDEAVGGEGAHVAGQRQHHVDLLSLLQREHVHDRPAARAARACRHFPDLEPVQPAAV